MACARGRCKRGPIATEGMFRLAQASSTVEQRPPAQGVAAEPGMQAVTLIASVPLDDRAWQPFAEGEVVVVAAGIVIHGGSAC